MCIRSSGTIDVIPVYKFILDRETLDEGMKNAGSIYKELKR